MNTNDEDEVRADLREAAGIDLSISWTDSFLWWPHYARVLWSRVPMALIKLMTAFRPRLAMIAFRESRFTAIAGMIGTYYIFKYALPLAIPLLVVSYVVTAILYKREHERPFTNIGARVGYLNLLGFMWGFVGLDLVIALWLAARLLYLYLQLNLP